jgi:CheY-like chemotaxis protein
MNGKILWIEDDYYHIKGLMKPMTKNGYEIVSASTYKKTLTLLANWQSYNIIVLDLIIPYSDTLEEQIQDSKLDFKPWYWGVKLYKTMKNELKINLPIVVLSIVRTNSVIEELENEGIMYRLEKVGLLPKQVAEYLTELIED